MRGRRPASCRLAFVGDEYVSLMVVGDNAVIEYSIDGKHGKEILKKRIAKKKYYKIVDELIKKHGYVFERV